MKSVLIAALMAGTAQAGEVRITVTGAEPGTGQILATLFHGAQDWMRRPTAERVVPVDGTGRAMVDFGDHRQAPMVSRWSMTGTPTASWT